ncbi:hypothetical protein NKG94_23780 [Micromonospora sp. M12]
MYGVGYAIDIMPPAAGARSKVDGLPLPSLQQLGARLVADRKAGVAGIRWLKYMNWEPERNNGGPCYQDSWKPNYARRTSSDRGHIHASGLTGYESSTIGAGYDPVTRIRGGDDMSAKAEQQIAELYDWMKSTGWADSVRALATLTGTPAAYTLPGSKQQRVEPNATAEALKRIEKQLTAVLAATGGADTGAVLAEIRRVAAAETERDARTAAALADLAELVRQAKSGELDADEFVRLVGEADRAGPGAGK